MVLGGGRRIISEVLQKREQLCGKEATMGVGGYDGEPRPVTEGWRLDAPLWLADYSKVDTLGARYKAVNFGGDQASVAAVKEQREPRVKEEEWLTLELASQVIYSGQFTHTGHIPGGAATSAGGWLD